LPDLPIALPSLLGCSQVDEARRPKKKALQQNSLDEDEEEEETREQVERGPGGEEQDDVATAEDQDFIDDEGVDQEERDRNEAKYGDGVGSSDTQSDVLYFS
jgi:hypothetical protein